MSSAVSLILGAGGRYLGPVRAGRVAVDLRLVRSWTAACGSGWWFVDACEADNFRRGRGGNFEVRDSAPRSCATYLTRGVWRLPTLFNFT